MRGEKVLYGHHTNVNLPLGPISKEKVIKIKNALEMYYGPVTQYWIAQGTHTLGWVPGKSNTFREIVFLHEGQRRR